ncbi:MAG: type II toxin-antitoxin system VapC family toxin [Sulfuricaulis sp.]
MPRIYWDSCVFIYRVQAVAPWAERIDRRLNGLSDYCLSFTGLTRLECRVLPLRTGDTELLALYDRLFASAETEEISFSRSLFDLATEFRARHHLKTPDALHVAAAIMSGCDEFWTNDGHLAQAVGERIRIVTVDG